MLEGLFVVIFFQSLILSALCFASKQQHNFWLGLLFATFAYQRFFQYVLGQTNLIENHSWVTITFEISVVTGLWALLMFILKTLGRSTREFVYLHSFATAGFLLLFLTGYFNHNWTGAAEYYHQDISSYLNIAVLIYSFFLIGVGLSQLMPALKELDIDSSQTRFALNAVKWLLYYWVVRSVFALIFLPMRVMALKDPSLLAQMENSYLLIVNIILVGLLLVTAYFALRNPAFFEHVLEPDANSFEQQIVAAVLPEEEKQMLKIAVSKEEADRIIQLLDTCMLDRKPWLNSKLSLSRLAEIIMVPSYKISKSIKQNGWQNVNEYINHYRVEHAKLLLSSEAHTMDTMYSIALDSGFASETPFYSAFKKSTGMSPAAWRMEQNNS